jgi:hypothetical protein
MVQRRRAVVLSLLTVVMLVGAGGVFAGSSRVGLLRIKSPLQVQRAPVSVAGKRVIVGHSYKNDTSPVIRRLRPILPGSRGERESSPNPSPRSTHRDARDTVVQHTLAKPHMPAPTLNFDGIGFPGVACSCAPPDTDGEVGPTEYVQMVNQGFQVFSKSGASIYGPADIATLWSGFGGNCELYGDGDPVVLYDQLANRWVISQFAGASIPTDECIAVSQTGDAAGAYYRYGYTLGANFYDYPHLGVWPDAYYMSDNVFNASGTAYLGPQPFAFNRSAMLAGNPGTVVTTGLLTPNDDAILPADLDGSIQPPAGAPNPFVEVGFNSTWPLWRFHVDFANPAASTFTRAGTLTPASYSLLCPAGRSCIPQAGTLDGLDAISSRPMFRSAYRRFTDGHEALVGNLTVASGGVAGIRWWQIDHATSGTPTLAQQGTYQPDTTSRWMGSAAMDAGGDMALGFSASSASIAPQIRYAGRAPGDSAGALGQGETTLLSGGGSQTGSGNRWGDYSDMTVDPSDDCTFWYTQEYYPPGVSAFNWRTRIGSFRMPTCAMWTLTTRRSGKGTVTSSPAGIACGGTCSFRWWGGNTIALKAKPSRGSAFAGWSGACSGKRACSVLLGSDKSVTAKFSKCKVPKVVGKKLTAARSRITKAFCKVGKITRKKSSASKRGKVIAQSPRPGKTMNAFSKVRLTVGA